MKTDTYDTLLSKPSPLTYEESRLLKKNNGFTGMCMLLKGTMGLGLIVNQYYQAKTGIILGPIITTVISFAVMYSVNCVLSLANSIETERGDSFKFETMDQLIVLVLGSPARLVTKAFTFGLNQAAIIINVINLSKFIHDRINRIYASSAFTSLIFIKLIVILLFLALVGVIVEPERLKYPAYISASLVLFSLFCMWTANLSDFIASDMAPNIHLADFSGTSGLLGSLLYSFKSIGIIFGVRSTLRHPKQMNRLVYTTYGIVIFLFSFNGISFLIVI